MNKKFEELRAAAMCRKIEAETIGELLDLVDQMGEKIDDAHDRVLDYDLQEKNGGAVQVLENNLDILEKAVLEFGNILLNK